MFEPTIKYKRVNEIKEPENSAHLNENVKNINQEKNKEEIVEKKQENKVAKEYIFEDEEEDSTIQVDPGDDKRIIVTLSTGKQYSADRYCPHAGADLSYHGKLGENDYGPEIGPIVLCQFHYWEFALERDGDGFGGRATINACPVAENSTPTGYHIKETRN